MRSCGSTPLSMRCRTSSTMPASSLACKRSVMRRRLVSRSMSIPITTALVNGCGSVAALR